jgi:DNA-binding transcriptional ArsR family regulator
MTRRDAPLSKKKFTRIPKIADLVADGVPLRAVPTFLALADHANNKTGETFVSVARVAAVLRVCRRTVERHLGALEAAGVIKRQRQRRGRRGRWSSCLRILVCFAGFAVRHSSTRRERRPIFTRTRPVVSPSYHPPDGYRWLFGKEAQYHDEEISNEHGELALFKNV